MDFKYGQNYKLKLRSRRAIQLAMGANHNEAMLSFAGQEIIVHYEERNSPRFIELYGSKHRFQHSSGWFNLACFDIKEKERNIDHEQELTNQRFIEDFTLPDFMVQGEDGQ